MAHLRPFYLLALVCAAALAMGACSSQPDVASLSTFTEGGVNMVVEIPAGTNLKIEYDKDRETFAPDQLNGRDRMVTFLPYPGNYGFIPATLMDEGQGGDGDPLDVLVLSSSQPTGTILEVKPIGMIRLRDAGDLDTKIIAVPLDPAQRAIDVETYRDFMIGYDGARRIVEEWFLNYKGLGTTQLLGWDDEAGAMAEIERWASPN